MSDPMVQTAICRWPDKQLHPDVQPQLSLVMRLR